MPESCTINVVVKKHLDMSPPRGGRVSKKKLKDRVSLFCSGQWDIMVEESLASVVNSAFVEK